MRFDIYFGKRVGEVGIGFGVFMFYFLMVVGLEGKVYIYE